METFNNLFFRMLAAENRVTIQHSIYKKYSYDFQVNDVTCLAVFCYETLKSTSLYDVTNYVVCGW